SSDVVTAFRFTESVVLVDASA
ncbi:hypothetical protein A2U01_0105362, partial [Trifolium medium]|nr:hypothetical protein [Trifolium medium]